MDDAEARAILREHGEEPPAKGKLGPQWTARAEELRQGPPPGEDSYDGGVSAADFDVTEAAPPPLPAEAKPRRPRSKARPSIAARIKEQASGKGKARKRHPRVPVDGLISSAWAAMGGLAGQIDPPLGRCLVMQAPVSGLILEDIVKGTAADRVLQPIARAEEKAEKVLALLAPPAIVAALEASQALPEAQRKAREAILVPLLERSMILWVRIAGDKVEAKAQQVAEEGPIREQVAALMAMIWAPPTDGPTPAESETVAA